MGKLLFGQYASADSAGCVEVLNRDWHPPTISMDAAPGTDFAFLVSELAKRDPLLREPLTAVTYLNDIPIEVGGGYEEFLQVFNVAYGADGGAINGPTKAPGANVIPLAQVNVGTDVFTAHTFQMNSLIKYIDMSRGNIVGRSIDQMNRDCINLFYRKHADANSYIGISSIGTTGLFNTQTVTATSVSAVGTQNSTVASTFWKNKTPAQIVQDIQLAQVTTWNASGNDLRAVPNKIVMPYTQLNYIAATPMGVYNDTTILEFILKNNLASRYGSELKISATAFASSAGNGNTDRMVVYHQDPYFLKMGEFVPLNRYMTAPAPLQGGYVSCYIAHLTQLCILYPQTMSYWDGI